MAAHWKGTVSAVRCEELVDGDQDRLGALLWHTVRNCRSIEELRHELGIKRD